MQCTSVDESLLRLMWTCRCICLQLSLLKKIKHKMNQQDIDLIACGCFLSQISRSPSKPWLFPRNRASSSIILLPEDAGISISGRPTLQRELHGRDQGIPCSISDRREEASPWLPSWRALSSAVSSRRAAAGHSAAARPRYHCCHPERAAAGHHP